jgi:glucose-6-phosphate isomerase
MNALHGRIARPGAPEIINLDTVHGPDIEALQEMLSDGMSPEQYLVFVVTKSGTTTETLVNAEALLTYVLPDTVITHDRLIVITDPNSCLANAAASLSVPVLTIPEQVGGRFSVFTAVGLAPLHAAGIDVVPLLQGARDIQPFAWHQDPAHNPAMQCAVRAYNAHEKGYTVYDTFVFAPQLELLGKWCRQLLGESLGKVRSTEAGDTPVGMVPTVSVGSTDLHSVGQFYLGGQPTVFTNFVHNTEPEVEFTVPETAIFTGTNPMIHGRTNIEIMNAIFAGTQEAYNEAERPFVRTELTGVTSYELGAFMQCKMLEVMYLAQLLEVNAFNQPHVESYKKFTRNRLEQ